MKNGNICLCNNKTGFIPTLIKFITSSTFSHSLITVPDVLGISMCIEAAETGVDFTRFDTGYMNNLSEGYEVWNIKIDQSIKDKAIIAMLSDLETSYGFLQFPFFVCRKFCLFFEKDIKAKNNWFAKDGMICSQLCVAYLNACGLSGVLIGYGQGSVAPQDLQNIFMAHPELFEKVESVRLTSQPA